MGAGNASNKSDDKKGGSTYSEQLNKIQKPSIFKQIIQTGGLTGLAIKGVKKAAEIGNKANRDFYENKVKPANKLDKNSTYESYMDGRTSGKTDAYGNKTLTGTDGGQPTNVIKKNIGGNTIQTTAPTEAEVSQSEAANADAAALKVKKRGRSASIMTSAKGITKTSSDYTLGVKNLLGRV